MRYGGSAHPFGPMSEKPRPARQFSRCGLLRVSGSLPALAAGLGAPAGLSIAAMKPPCATTTLGDLHRGTPWLWLNCERCQHHAPLACAVAVIRWGRDASSDILRERALHALRPQGRNAPASRLGQCERRLPAVSGMPKLVVWGSCKPHIIAEHVERLAGAGEGSILGRCAHSVASSPA